MNCLNNSLVEGEAEVGAQKTAGESVGVLLPLVGAPSGISTSSSLPPRGGLRQRLR